MFLVTKMEPVPWSAHDRVLADEPFFREDRTLGNKTMLLFLVNYTNWDWDDSTEAIAIARAIAAGASNFIYESSFGQLSVSITVPDFIYSMDIAKTHAPSSGNLKTAAIEALANAPDGRNYSDPFGDFDFVGTYYGPVSGVSWAGLGSLGGYVASTRRI